MKALELAWPKAGSCLRVGQRFTRGGEALTFSSQVSDHPRFAVVAVGDRDHGHRLIDHSPASWVNQVHVVEVRWKPEPCRAMLGWYRDGFR